MSTRYIKSLLILLLSTQSAFAGYSDLMNLPTRPTIEQVLKNWQELKKNPPQAFLGKQDVYLSNRGNQNLHFQFDYWLNSLIAGGPQFIASLEKAFPGATWAFIGRDSMVLADMLDAFYLSINQKNRVVRVGMSKETLANSTSEQIVQYIESLGFDLRTVNQNNPFILVDTLSGGYGRQGRAIIKAIYDKYVSQGGRPEELVRLFNMVGVTTSTFKGAPEPIEKSQSQFNNIITEYVEEKHPQYSKQPILTYDGQKDYFGESGYEHYTGAWHESFKALIQDQNGRVSSNPGNILDEKYRTAIIQFQMGIIDKVNTSDFFNKVKEEALKIGYTFPTVRQTTNYKQFKKDILILHYQKSASILQANDHHYSIGQNASLREDVQDFFSTLVDPAKNENTLSIYEKTKIYFGAQKKSNMDLVLNRYKKYKKSPQLTYEFLREVVKNHGKNLFTPNETLTLLAIFISNSNPTLKVYNLLTEIINKDSFIKNFYERNFEGIDLNENESSSANLKQVIKELEKFRKIQKMSNYSCQEIFEL